jgi:nicotinate-nucleotide adenylyltransferase
VSGGDAQPPGSARTAAAPTYALFGGSFNPPHVAHVLAATWALETQAVDGAVVVPCFRHPFDKQLASFDDRLKMCQRAFAPLGGRVVVSTVERDRDAGDGTPSRTLDTIVALGERWPGVRFRLIIGADILPERHKWWRWDEVERLAPPIVIGRQGFSAPPELGELVDMPGISSTEVRARLGRGEAVDQLVPRAVLEYIFSRSLYQGP